MRKDGQVEIYQSSNEIDAIDLDNLENRPGNCKSISSIMTFDKHTSLQMLYSFINNDVKIYYKDVEVNDPIIGRWDIHPFLRFKYKITIEEIYPPFDEVKQ